MPKIDLESVSFILEKVQLPTDKKSEIYEELNKLLEEEQIEKEVKKERTKMELLACVIPHRADLALDDLSVFLLSIPRDSAPEEALSNLKAAAQTSNGEATKKKNIVNNLREIINHLKGKYLKPYGMKKPAKEYVRTVFVDPAMFENLSQGESSISSVTLSYQDKEVTFGSQSLVNEDAQPVSEFVAQEELS